MREKKSKSRFYSIKGRCNMLNDEICKLREQLNDSILNGEDYLVDEIIIV